MPRTKPHRYDVYAKAHEKDTLQAVRARRLLLKELGPEKLKGKDVDHRLSIKGGGSNARSNLRLRDPHANRSDKTFGR